MTMWRNWKVGDDGSTIYMLGNPGPGGVSPAGFGSYGAPGARDTISS